MSYRVLRLSVLPLSCALLLWGCSTGPDFVARDEPWRKQEELACLASGAVKETPYIRTARTSLGGPSEFCGAERAFEVAATSDSRVGLQPSAFVGCPMIPKIDDWVANVVEPAARQHLGGSLAELRVAASYSCRAMNHQSGAKLSEHGHANAIDISAFKLTDRKSVV